MFLKARQVPYSLRKQVEEELERLVAEGIIYPVESSEWATPVVVVPKTGGKIRLCGDFRVTVNKNIRVDKYPLPRVEDIFATLGGSVVFSKIDLRNAYLQLELAEESKELCTLNTLKGLYRYHRLPFGVASAPAIWQRTIEQVLHGIRKTQCMMDDIIIAGANEEEHFNILEEVLARLDSHNITINMDKCAFLQ